jgi:hypothetical protein
MMQNELITKKDVCVIGEEIGYELGTQMVKDYQVANPQDTPFYTIGRKIIDQILAQPGCVGMRFYNAYNEMGEKTLVYIGLDENGQGLFEYSVVDNQGVLSTEKGIVADRAGLPGSTRRGSSDEDAGWWDVD